MSSPLPALLRFGNWPVGRRVMVVVAIPLLLAVALGVIQTTGAWEEARAHREAAARAVVLPHVVNLVEAGSAAAAATHLDNLRAADDARIHALQVHGSTAGLDDHHEFNATQRSAFASMRRHVAQLAASGEKTSAEAAVAELRHLQRATTSFLTALGADQNANGNLLPAITRALEGRLRLAVQQVQDQSSTSRDDQIRSSLTEIGAEAAVIEALGEHLGVYHPRVERLRQQNASRRDATTFGFVPRGHATAVELYGQVTTDFTADLTSQLQQQADRSERRAWVVLAATLLALLLTLGAAVLVARSLVRPLRRLASAAHRISEIDLPRAVTELQEGRTPGTLQPVDVDSTDEVGAVARAVDDMHHTAVRLASDQATLRSQVNRMFVTLSRRTTTLVNQQLRVMEGLQSTEQDPDKLEEYFRLDHLTTRLRRNADSLMVLAGGPARKGTEQVRLVDVVEAATAGVAAYQRVLVLPSHVDDLVRANAAPDLVHLLTELLDNALTYSSPRTRVNVGVSQWVDGATITIQDEGIGISPESVVELNAILAAPGEPTEETTRRMGVFVSGRIAQRLGVDVSLARNPRGGTTATVRVPEFLLSSGADGHTPRRRAMGPNASIVDADSRVASPMG